MPNGFLLYRTVMSENPILISNLNDFVFCPVSIFFHALDEDKEEILMQDPVQLNGSAAHEKVDSAAYSTRKSMLQGIPVYCEKYNLIGKIDTFDSVKGILTERKKKIKMVYDSISTYASLVTDCNTPFTKSRTVSES